MRELRNRIFSKPTFISVVGILLILTSIPVGIYNYNKADYSTEGWVLTFMLFLFIIVGILIAVDRVLVKVIRPWKLSLIEMTLTVVTIVALTYTSRQLFIDLGESKQDFTIIIENDGTLQNSKSTSLSLFDSEINTDDNLIIVDEIPKDVRLNVRPKSWNGSHYYNRYSYDKYDEVILFSNAEFNFKERISETFIDSLIERKNKN